jgi:nucleoside diphosphate kinase
MLPVSASDNAAAFARLAALYPTPPAASTAGAPPAPRSAGAGDACDEAFVLLRPAAVKAGLVSEICKRLQQRGLRLAGLKMLKPGSDLVRAHCGPAAGGASDAQRALVLELAAGPVVATLWRGPSALAASLALIGDADPCRALPGTVRGDLNLAIAGCLVEVAPTAAEGERLGRLWLTDDDIVDGKAAPAVPAAPSAPSLAPVGKPGGSVQPRAGDRFYITTAINYANGAPHMGHAYEAVTADVIARYHRAYGREVFFLTGSDEHGQKIADTAAAQGVKPIQLCDSAVAGFQVRLGGGGGGEDGG